MRFPGLPRLPVSRRRHGFTPSGDTSREDIPPPPETGRALPETKRLLDEAREAFYAVRRERDEFAAALRTRGRQLGEARARVAELERAIVEHRMVRRGSDVRHPYPEDDERLWRVLDGHDRQERGDGKPCYVCGGHWGAAQKILVGNRWRHADCDPPARNAVSNYRPERGYASSTQPPTGKPPSDPGPARPEGGRR